MMSQGIKPRFQCPDLLWERRISDLVDQVRAVGHRTPGAQCSGDEGSLRQLFFGGTGVEGSLPVHIEAIWALGGEPYSHRHQFLILLWDGPICQGGLVESLKARHCLGYR